MQNRTTSPMEPFELKPLPPEEWPNIDHIITEDGAPVDNVLSEKHMRLLTESLYASWKPDRPFVALANVGLFYGVDIQPLVPDVLLSVNVCLPEDLRPKLNRSYFVWKYGRPPDVVIEIVSNSKGGEDSRKLELYADVRVANYVIFDPESYLSAEKLRVYRLRGDRLDLDVTRPCRFESIGLGLTIWSGRFENMDGDWLRWTKLDGALIPTGAERAEVAERRAESAEQRAESAEQRAENMARENARLLELLSKHNIAAPRNSAE
jgi:Uma2 family endonuclease